MTVGDVIKCGDCKYWSWFETDPEFPEQELGRCDMEDKSCFDVRYISDIACKHFEKLRNEEGG